MAESQRANAAVGGSTARRPTDVPDVSGTIDKSEQVSMNRYSVSGHRMLSTIVNRIDIRISRRRLERVLLFWLLSGGLLVATLVPAPKTWLLAQPEQDNSPRFSSRITAAQGGEPVTHVKCEPGYSATLYASGLDSPDGLAFDPAGVLHVVEEGARRVSRIEPDGTITPILDDLRSPEGLTFDGAGSLYVVEDTRNGRLLKWTPDGQFIPLAKGLDAPEDVAVTPIEPGRPADTVYATESNIQFVRSPYNLLTGIAAVSSPGEVTHVITHTPTINGSTVAFWSYAGLTPGPDGRLYVTNELSRQEITRQVVIIPDVLTYTATLFTSDSVFAIDPVRGTRTLVSSGLLAPEGLSFSADGDFPLYVAEENVGYQGRLSRIERDGRRTTVCGSFRGIEDVVVDTAGNLYVSEDKSGFVIRITVSEAAGPASSTPAPTPQAAGTPTPLPDARSTRESILQSLWRQLVAFVRQIARLVRAKQEKNAGPAQNPVLPPASTAPLVPTAERAPSARMVVRGTGDQGLRCRSEPGLHAEIIGRLVEGAVATAVGGPVHQDGYDWWQIELPDETPCWAAADWLDPLNAPD